MNHYKEAISEMLDDYKSVLTKKLEGKLFNLLIFISVIFRKVDKKGIKNIKVMDIGCGSSKSEDLKYIDNFIWQPWVSRFLFELGVKKIVGIDIADNSQEKFNSLKIDLFSCVESRKIKNKTLIASELFDVIINKDFTGFIGSIENRRVSPSLFHGMEYDFYQRGEEFSLKRFDLFRKDLAALVYENLLEGGFYIVISSNEYKIYKKRGDGFFLFEEGVYKGVGFFVGINE